MTQATTFAPKYGSGVTVSPGAVSANSALGQNNKSLCITNLSLTVVSYVRTGNAGLTATAADYPIPPSAQVSISKPDDHDYIAYIAPATGGSIHIMAGEGF
jgi:hypothetical protein